MNYVYAVDEHKYFLSDGPGDTCRLMAHPSQSPYIEALRKQTPTEVVSVSAVHPEDKDDPQAVLQAMREAEEVPPERGGWRPIKDAELAALTFSRLAVDCTPPMISMELQQAMDTHPVVRGGWMYATGGLLTMPAMGLLSEIYDIRRFARKRDPWRVDKLPPKRLLKFLRLHTPVYISMYLSGQKLEDKDMRARVSHQAWHMVCSRSDRPCDFLMRECVMFAGKKATKAVFGSPSPEEYQEAADVAFAAHWMVTKRYVEFMRRLWIAGVSEETEFTPETFFYQEEEIEGYSRYIKELDKSLDNLHP